MGHTLVDVTERHRKNPDTFEIPSQEEIDNLEIQDYCKVILNDKERIWVQITDKISKDFFKGTVENDTVFKEIHGLDFKDVITFKSIHICDILKPLDL